MTDGVGLSAGTGGKPTRAARCVGRAGINWAGPVVELGLDFVFLFIIFIDLDVIL
jgi:hypothetical protein